MYAYLLYVGGPGGDVKAEVENPAVSSNLLKDILKWQGEGSTMKDIIIRLRQRTVYQQGMNTIHGHQMCFK